MKATLGGLLNYFRHRITNALTEGFDSKIQALKADARGVRRLENYCTRILFSCGKLDLAHRFIHPLPTRFREVPPALGKTAKTA